MQRVFDDIPTGTGPGVEGHFADDRLSLSRRIGFRSDGPLIRNQRKKLVSLEGQVPGSRR
jgi:hypothetical protein